MTLDPDNICFAGNVPAKPEKVSNVPFGFWIQHAAADSHAELPLMLGASMPDHATAN